MKNENVSSDTAVTEQQSPYNTYSTSTQQPPELPPYQFSWGGYVKALSTLFFILALVVILLLIIKRKGSVLALSSNVTDYFKKGNKTKKRSSLPLVVEQRYSIDQRKSLLVVQFLNKKLLLGVTDASIQVLEESLEKGTITHDEDVATFNAHLAGLGKSDDNSKTT